MGFFERPGRLANRGCGAWRANRSVGAYVWYASCGNEQAQWSGFGRFEELAHGVLGSSGVVSMGLGEEVESSLDPHDGDGEVGQAGEVARQVTGAHPASVFVVGDIANVMKTIFDSSIVLLLFRSTFSGFLIIFQHTETKQ